ncbi:MAG TPA: tetratricopeptide repeat protein [Rhodocyclaceae bacterium]
MKRTIVAAALAALLSGCGTSLVSGALRTIDSEPDLASLNREAELAYESGEAAKAEVLYRSLARRMPNDAETWLRLGNLYARNNRPDEASAAYQRALILNNTDPRAWNNLAVVRLRQAMAALVQAQACSKEKTPLAGQIDENLEQLAKLPLLEDQPRHPDPRMATGSY